MTRDSLSGEQLHAGFMAADAARDAGRSTADKLRVERAVLMEGWAALVATQDFDQIAKRAKRLAEIDRALARLGV